MNCEEFSKHIFAYLTNKNFDQKLKEAMEEHYFECDECFNKMELTSSTIGAIRTEGVDKLLQYSKEVSKQAPVLMPKERQIFMIEELDDLKSEVSLPCLISNYDTISGMPNFDNVMRGGEQEKVSHVLGERVIIRMKPPKDGYLTVIHYDDEHNLNLLFPHKATDETLIRAGKEKNIGIEAREPIGKHYIKAIWTSNQMIDPKKINFSKKSDIASALEEFLSSLKELRSDEWMESLATFEIIES